MRKQKNILVVDDNIKDKETLQMMLQINHKVYLAEDAGRILELIYKDKIDVVTINLGSINVQPIKLIRTIKQYDPYIEIIAISHYTDLETTLKALQYGISDYFPKPFRMPKILTAINRAIGKRQLNLELKHRLEKMANPIELATFLSEASASYSAREKQELLINLISRITSYALDEKNKVKNLRPNYLQLVKALTSTLESKDSYTYGHSERVSYYSGLIAERLDLATEDKEEIQMAALLHDIGKLGISNLLIDKEVPLDSEDWELIKQHPEKGVDLIYSLQGSSKNLISYIRHHHERFDGCGYPYGLTGKSIPLGGRVIGVADAYDAMTSDRAYKKIKMSPLKAQQELIKCTGSQFDPYLVGIFITALRTNVNVLSSLFN